MQRAFSNRNHAFTLLIAIVMSVLPFAARAATTGTLQGIVKNAEGAPVAGANVVVVEAHVNDVTKPDGSYSINGLDPGIYTVQVTLRTYKTTSVKTTVTQDLVAKLDFSLEKEVVERRGTAVGGGVPRSGIATGGVISAGAEQKDKSQPNNLYQFPGLLFGQPGITYDPGGYVHIRGSDLFQVGFQVDGISIINPITNEFGTNLVTVGLKSANFYTNGADASYGGATGGFINEITASGRDMHAQGVKGITELTIGPGQNWQYIGTNTQLGDVSNDGKYDYYLSTIRFRNKFPTEGFSVTNLPDSQDTSVKFNYYADPNNTITAYYAHGLENYIYNTTSNFKVQQATGDLTQQPGPYTSQDTQHYDMGYVNLKHRFNTNSFATARFYSVYSTLDRHLEAFNGQYRKDASTSQGYQVDYQNQLNQKFQLNAGAYYLPVRTNYHVITGLSQFSYTDPNGVGSSGYTDRSSLINPKQTVLYLAGILKPVGDKLTFNLGVRTASQKYDNTQRIAPYTKRYTDPRLGAAFSPSRDLAFHATFDRFSQFAETRYTEYDAPETNTIYPATARNPAAQLAKINSRYTPSAIDPEYSENFDLGVDKSFKALGGQYAVSLDGFSKKQYDLIQLNYASYVGSPYPLQYRNNGRGQASGAEFVFSKKASNDYDVNGYISYTNQVARATSSAFDTGYLPYFANSVSDPTLTDAQYISFNSRNTRRLTISGTQLPPSSASGSTTCLRRAPFWMPAAASPSRAARQQTATSWAAATLSTGRNWSATRTSPRFRSWF